MMKKSTKRLRFRNLLSQYQKDNAKYTAVVAGLDDDNLKYESGLGLFKHKIPMDFLNFTDWIDYLVVP
jgi:hypothetical protein